MKELAEARIVKNFLRRRGFGQYGHDDVCFRQDPLIHRSVAEHDLSARILVYGFNIGFRASKQESESESTVSEQAKYKTTRASAEKILKTYELKPPKPTSPKALNPKAPFTLQ